MSRPRGLLVGLGATVAIAFAAIGIATAQESEPEPVPEGPEIAFCPSQEQSEAHLAQYGFDYKPTVACEGEELAAKPVEPMPDDPDGDLGGDALMEKMADELSRAEPLPDSDDNPNTLEGELPSGRRIEIDLMVPPEPGTDINELGEDLQR